MRRSFIHFLLAFFVLLSGCSPHRTRCVYLSEKREYKDALDCWDSVIKNNANDRNAYLDRAMVYYLTGQYAKALQDISYANGLKPLDIDDVNLKANCLFKLGLPDSALTQFYVVYSQDHNYKLVNYNIATTYFENGDATNALKYITQEIPHSPKCDSCYGMQAMCLFELKRYRESEQAYSQALKCNPARKEYFMKRAACYGVLKDFKQAIEDCNSAIALDSNYSDAYLLRAFDFQNSGKQEDACRDFDKLKLLDSASATKYGSQINCK
jgi:tetratricopeptide (TPR) repeat protein